MQWNAHLYDDKHDFVAQYGRELTGFVPKDSSLTILDLGCGTGTLTQQLLKKTPHVWGVDSSRTMIEKAKALYPQIKWQTLDVLEMTWENKFDIVFSNAVFHWIIDQQKLLFNIHSALKKDGKLICEFGAVNNIATIENAFAYVMAKANCTYVSRFYFPTVKQYRQLLFGNWFSN